MSSTTKDDAPVQDGTTHTPGPWLFVDGSDKRMWGYIRKPLAPVADEENRGRIYGPAVARVCGSVPITEAEANARLIAAAPDLLAALKSLRNEALGALGIGVADCIGHTNARCLGDRCQEAFAAIAKAEGK